MTISQFYTAPFPYMYGLQLSWASNTTLTLQPGVCRDSTNSLDMNIGNYGASNAASITINGAVNGFNGLDTGALAANQWYAVYVLADQAGFNAPGAIISINTTSPVMPQGSITLSNYSSYRRIGWVLTDASSHFLKFYQSGIGSQRYYQWDNSIIALNNVTIGSGSPTAASLASAVPPIATMTYFNIKYVSQNSGDTIEVRPSTGTSNFPGWPVTIICGSSGIFTFTYSGQKCYASLSSNVPTFQLLTASGGACTIYIVGFDDPI